MRSALLSATAALAAGVAHASPFVAVTSVSNVKADADLKLIAPEFFRYRMPTILAASTPPANGSATAVAADRTNSNATTCGAFESTTTDGPLYVAATAQFMVPHVSTRASFNWTLSTEVTPRMAVSVGLDGIACPETVRSGVYGTVLRNGTQKYVPFVEFSGQIYAASIASVTAGEIVRVTVSLASENVVNIDWVNLNRTDQAFNKNIGTSSNMCGQTVSWFVEDLVPYKAHAGEYFAAFEPVRFSMLQGATGDGGTIAFDASTANFTTEQGLCRVEETGTELLVTST